MNDTSYVIFDANQPYTWSKPIDWSFAPAEVDARTLGSQSAWVTTRPYKGKGMEALSRMHHSSADFQMCILLACLLVVVYVLHHSGQQLRNQARRFFFPIRHEAESDNTPSPGVTHPYWPMGLVLALVVATSGVLLFDEQFYYTYHDLKTPALVLGVLLGGCIAYLLVREGLYAIVDWVFFSRSKSRQWRSERLFLLAMEGFALFGILALGIFADLPASTRVSALVCLVVFTRFALFFKAKSIFFRQMRGYLHIFPYLCALEIAPLLILYKLATGFVLF